MVQDGDGASGEGAAAAAAAPWGGAPRNGISGGGCVCIGGSGRLSSAVENVRGGVAQLEAALADLVAAAAAEREELAREREKLEAERRALEAEHGRVAAALCDSEQVTLNVGGQRFTTTVATLRGGAVPGAGASLFAAMFSGRHVLRRCESDGSIFIDRDGRHFGDVLNYLRTGQLAYPPDGRDFKYLLDLRAEAEFFGLPGLTARIDRYPFGVARAPRAGLVNRAAHWAYEEEGGSPDAIAFRVSRCCQLLAVGLCGTDGAYSGQVKVLEAGSEIDPLYAPPRATLGGGACTVTSADGEHARCDLDAPVTLEPGRLYVIELDARGSISYSCAQCLTHFVAAGVSIEVLVFESENGTTAHEGQFPDLYIRAVAD